MAATPPIVVITGQLAAGRSTLARPLLAGFPFRFQVNVDAVREMLLLALGVR